jgi:hypothetical protein
MPLYIPHSIFHLARLLYVRSETFGPYYVVEVHKQLAGVKARVQFFNLSNGSRKLCHLGINSLGLLVCRRCTVYVVTVLTLGSLSVKRNFKVLTFFIHRFIYCIS